jgi:thioredoxin 1
MFLPNCEKGKTVFKRSSFDLYGNECAATQSCRWTRNWRIQYFQEGNETFVMETQTADFNEFIRSSDLPVLADFWAAWCGPCRMMSPVIKELAHDWKGRIVVVKVNTEEKQHLTQQYGISAIPTMVLFKNGAEIHRVSGAMPLNVLKSELEKFL